MKKEPIQERTNMFAELLTNSSSKIFLEAIDQIFDQENPVTQVENPDSSNFDPEMEKMYDKFCDSLDGDLVGTHGQSLIKDYSTIIRLNLILKKILFMEVFLCLKKNYLCMIF